MRLKELNIRRAYAYEGQKGMIGTMLVESPRGEVKVNLSEAACQRMVELAAAGIVEAAQETAQMMVADVSALSLEGPSA